MMVGLPLFSGDLNLECIIDISSKRYFRFSVVLQAIEEAEHLMEANEFDVNSTQVMSLVSNSLCSAYDCEFVALADDLNVPLVTFDKKISMNFQILLSIPRNLCLVNLCGHYNK